MTKTYRNNTIDIIKGIAIIIVLFTHYEWTNDQRKVFIFPYIINMAIPLFMVITGYVYSISMKKSLTRWGSKPTIEDAYQWQLILSRVARYTIPLMPIIIWELLDPKFGVSKIPLDVLRWIIDGTGGKGNYYYPVMLQLIFLFPVIYFVIARKREKGLWICLAINAVYELLAWAYMMNTECYRLLVFRYIFLIAVGVYAFNGYILKTVFKIGMILSGAVFIYAVTYLNYEPRIVNSAWASTNFIASMWIVPLMIWVLQNVHIRFKPLEIVGQASYHIFLVQMAYYRGYYAVLQEKVLTWQSHLAVGILICLVVGIAFYYIEKPLQNWTQLLISNLYSKSERTQSYDT